MPNTKINTNANTNTNTNTNANTNTNTVLAPGHAAKPWNFQFNHLMPLINSVNERGLYQNPCNKNPYNS